MREASVIFLRTEEKRQTSLAKWVDQPVAAPRRQPPTAAGHRTFDLTLITEHHVSMRRVTHTWHFVRQAVTSMLCQNLQLRRGISLQLFLSWTTSSIWGKWTRLRSLEFIAFKAKELVSGARCKFLRWNYPLLVSSYKGSTLTCRLRFSWNFQNFKIVAWKDTQAQKLLPECIFLP